jgi:predicted secreted protein
LEREIGCALVRLRAMDRRLARRNLRTALITAVIGLLMFALTFVAAELYI